MKKEKNIEGLGGWLILIAIGIVVTPVKILMLIISTYSEVFSTGIWEALTTQGGEAYNPLWAPIIIGEMLINGILILAWLYMGYKFFTKRYDFPMWYIGIAIFSLSFIIVDASVVKFILPNEPLFNPDTLKGFIHEVLRVLVWGPYMLISKRVKVTFVH